MHTIERKDPITAPTTLQRLLLILVPLFWPSSLKREVRSPRSDLNTTCDCSSPSASHNNLSNETSTPGNENSFHGLLELQLGNPDAGIHFWIVWVNTGWHVDNPGFLL